MQNKHDWLRLIALLASGAVQIGGHSLRGCIAMLVLTRREGERIQIGDNVCVTVVRIVGGGVRLGVEAPPEVSVLRAEVKQKIDREHKETSTDKR
jgi:carbon storage regulator